MSGMMYGADADELEQIAKELENHKSELGQLLVQGVGAVSLVGLSATLGSIWRGPRAGEFAGLWQSRHLLRLRDAQQILDVAANDLRGNAREQRRTSSALSDRVMRVPEDSPEFREWLDENRPGIPRALVPPFVESRIGLDTSQEYGFIFRSDYESSVYTEFRSDHTSTAFVDVYEGTKVSVGDIGTLFELATFPKSLAADGAGIKLELDANWSSGVRRTFGWDENQTHVVDHFRGKQTSFWNNVGDHFGVDDVAGSINAGEIENPDSVRITTSAVSADVSIGASGAGMSTALEFGGSVEMYEGRLSNGGMSEGVTFSAEQGLRVEAGGDVLGLGGGVDVAAVALQGGGVEIIRGEDGSVQQVIVSETLGISGEANASILGAWSGESDGVTTQRTLTFDFDDPQVRLALGDDPSVGTVLRDYTSHRQMAGEMVVSYETNESSNGLNLLTSGSSAAMVSEDALGASYRHPGSSSYSKVIP